MNVFPGTVSPTLFLLSLPFLIAFVSLGKRTSARLRAGRKEKVWVCSLVGVGITYVLGMLALALPIINAKGHFFLLTFSWFCAHGWPAFLVARMTIGLVREYLGQRNSYNSR